MAGRNKQPLHVIMGKGRSKHITKAEAKKRFKQEVNMRGPVQNIIAPKYLSVTQRREFDEIAAKLTALNIFSELDIDVLARYLDSKYQYLLILKELKKIKPTIKVKDDEGNEYLVSNDSYSKLQRTKNTLFNECRAAASDLGLSITSRLKLVVPEPPEYEEKSKAEKRFSGRL